jgi:hypothetical protein
MLLCMSAQPLAFDRFDPLQGVEPNARLVEHHRIRVRARDSFRAELLQLFDSIDRHVARFRHDARLALEVFAAHLQHFLEEEDGAIAGGFIAHPRTAPMWALARQHAGLVAIGDALVLPDQVVDFAPAHGAVAGGHIREFANVPVPLRHEALAKAHPFAVGLPLGSKSEPPFAPPIGMPVTAFLKTRSKPRNLMILRYTAG